MSKARSSRREDAATLAASETGQPHPLPPPSGQALTVRYRLSRQLREKLFAKYGFFPPVDYALHIDVSALSPVQRGLIARHIDDDGILQLCRYLPSLFDHTVLCRKDLEVLWDQEVSTSDELISVVEAMDREHRAVVRKSETLLLESCRRSMPHDIERYEQAIYMRNPFLESTPELCGPSAEVLDWAEKRGVDVSPLRNIRKKYQRLQPKFALEHKEAEKQRTQDEAAREKHLSDLRHERFAIRRDWAMEHGSAHLRRALEAGHDAARLLWNEYTDYHYPGYIYDHQDKAEWRSRGLPSVAALDERDRILEQHPHADVTIVWLTVPPQTISDRRGTWEPCEAVAIQDGKFDQFLIKIMESTKE